MGTKEIADDGFILLLSRIVHAVRFEAAGYPHAANQQRALAGSMLEEMVRAAPLAGVG